MTTSQDLPDYTHRAAIDAEGNRIGKISRVYLEQQTGQPMWVLVETGLFGPAEGRTVLSIGDFSLRINGKKAALPSLPYGLSFASLKDPQWEPPSKPKSEKPTLDAGGGQPDDSFHPIVRMPIELKRTMQQRVQRASMPQGDRPLPQAGLLFFEYRGKTDNIRSLELIYSGPAGKATLALQP